jgi:chemotaxis protein histidine kinase CheA
MAKLPEPSRAATEFDDAGDFLAQFLSANPQNFAPPPPPAPIVAEPAQVAAPVSSTRPVAPVAFNPPPAPAPVAAPEPETGSISLADLLPDLFGDEAPTASPFNPGPQVPVSPPASPSQTAQPNPALPNPVEVLPPASQPRFEVELSPKERKQQEKLAKLEQKKQARLAKLEQKQEAKLAKLEQKNQTKAAKQEQKRLAAQTKLLPKEEQRLAQIQQQTLQEQQKQRQIEEARREKEQQKQAQIEQKESYQRAKLTREQKAREKQLQLELKEREKQIRLEQKAQEKEVRQAQKERERELRLVEKEAQKAEKEQDKQLKAELKEKEKLARLGLLAAEGEELTEEQKFKLDALKSMGSGGSSNIPVFIAGAIALFIVAGFLMLTVLVPSEVTLDDLKAPDNSVRFDFKDGITDGMVKAIVDTKGFDAKTAKQIKVSMVAATNTMSPGQVADYFTKLAKEKEFRNSSELDPAVLQGMTPRGVGPVVRAMAWPTKDPTKYELMVVLLIPLNGGSAGALNPQVQNANGPASGSGTIILMGKVSLPT